MRGRLGGGLLLAALVLVCAPGCKKEPEEPGPRDLTVCAEQERNCGTAVDGNGGTVECGTCSATQTCGGGGHEGLCGGSHCALECPTGFTCSDGVTCTGGPRQGIALDLKVSEVEGRLLRDGAPIADTSCTHHEFTHTMGNEYHRSYLELTEVRLGTRYYVHFSCSAESGWTFRGWVPPGAYGVVFHPEPYYSSQKHLEGLELSTFFSVQADREDVVFDVSTPPVTEGGREERPWRIAAAQSTAHEVAGRMVFEGDGTPPECPRYGNYYLQLSNVATGEGPYTLAATCTWSAEQPSVWAFSGSLPSGTYSGTFRVDDVYNGRWYTFPLASELAVDGPSPDLEARVTVTKPPQFPEVSGTLTLKGQPIGAKLPCGHTANVGGIFGRREYFYPHVVLIDEQEGDTWRLPITCGNTETGDGMWTFSGQAPAGTYRVELQLDYLYRPEALLTSVLLDFVPGPVVVFNSRLQLP